ncbi:MAG: tRNA preQ1(34) S-adenosylmethionine ribosyltransferase-isomerase QueA [Patescibacteria group bacterium]
MYKVSDFDYYLPSELIAQNPARPRDHSRLLVLNRKTGAISHQHFFNIGNYLRPGDLLVLNNSKVFPARLLGYKKETGGAVEIFLHRQLSTRGRNNLWECLIGGRVKSGTFILLKKRVGPSFKSISTELQAEIIKDNGDGTWQVRFNITGQKFFRVINKIGEIPLPPYIKRARRLASDRPNYQTVFADNHRIGSAAAPTAGLHFTKDLLKKIKAQGVKIEYVTLHVGLGTFAPVKADKIIDHKMHSELAIVSAKTKREILKIKRAGGRVIAVGTTSCRTLESLDWGKRLGGDLVGSNNEKVKKDSLSSQSFWTDIFIYPGYKFKIIDALITNFHLPKSTLIMLVSALAGKPVIDKAYQEAIRQKYRFFSYGDVMFIC